MTSNRTTIANRAMRELAPYTPEDGPCIDVRSLLEFVPGVSAATWVARTTGSGVSNGYKPIKTPPLLGRTRAGRVVILASSFAEWRARIRPNEQPEFRADLVARMVAHTASLLAAKVAIASEARMMQRLESEAKAKREKPPKAHATRAKAEISRDVFSVWR